MRLEILVSFEFFRPCKIQVDDTTTADFHRDVSCMLMRLGRQHQNEGLTEVGLFRVDCLIADRQIVLEVDGPQHFVECLPNGGDAPQKSAARGLRFSCHQRAFLRLERFGD